ncbi:MAG: hypothetical protein VKL39_08330 [Leptolyngbyaceae bacterium]|nr:hypothetical protein [Leptolyngbyaceae bacterium]
MEKFGNTPAKRFVGTTLLTFVIIVLIHTGLPLLLLVFNVPSFEVGDRWWWLLQWQNDAEGFAIRFNLVPIIIVAIACGLLSLLVNRRPSPKQQKNEADRP